MKILRIILLAPLSWLYGLVVALRNMLYDWGVLKSVEFNIPIVCVGNITVGGTGKTPMTEYLIQTLSRRYNVAVLSRGYKRKKSGFILAKPQMSYRRIGDEPKQIKVKFPTIPVAVCESRVKGIRKLREIHPEINLIILDDAFQHRAVEPWVSIVLMDYNRPIYRDRMLPLGRLRDNRHSMHRAHMVVATKCPPTITPYDCRLVLNYLDLYACQSLYISSVRSGDALPLFPANTGVAGAAGALELGSPVLLLAALANPQGFIDHCRGRYDLQDQIILPDHHTIGMRDIRRLERKLSTLPPDTKVVMTEKDAVKLLTFKRLSDQLKAKIYCIAISVEIGETAKFERILWQYVAKNQKYSITHPE